MSRETHLHLLILEPIACPPPPTSLHRSCSPATVSSTPERHGYATGAGRVVVSAGRRVVDFDRQHGEFDDDERTQVGVDGTPEHRHEHEYDEADLWVYVLCAVSLGRLRGHVCRVGCCAQHSSSSRHVAASPPAHAQHTQAAQDNPHAPPPAEEQRIHGRSGRDDARHHLLRLWVSRPSPGPALDAQRHRREPTTLQRHLARRPGPLPPPLVIWTSTRSTCAED